MLEEAAKRDHRKLGREMDLFHMQEEAPGQVFWHPNGWTIYTTLQDYMRRKQRAGGYREINTPQVVDRKLWEASGHWDKYQHHMFIVEVDESRDGEKTMPRPTGRDPDQRAEADELPLPCAGLQPGPEILPRPAAAPGRVRLLRTATNPRARCTASCGCAGSPRTTRISSAPKTRSSRNAPASSSCSPTSTPTSASRPSRSSFATRPEKRIGSEESWDYVEKALENAMQGGGRDFDAGPGDGAFYGPKLDFYLTDAIGRAWQCGTFQVDPNLPDRLDASYIAQDGDKHRPFMLHRAVPGLASSASSAS